MNKFEFKKKSFFFEFLKFVWWSTSYIIFLGILSFSPVNQKLEILTEQNTLFNIFFQIWVFSPIIYGCYKYIKLCKECD
jgi:hypothetical protein